MVISSLVAIKIAYGLAREMVNLEAAKRLAPNLFFETSRRLLSDIISKQSDQETVDQNEEEVKNNQDSVSTEYLVHNWLEALFAWFQIVILWHEPSVSIGAITGLLTSFLFLTYFAPKFYATVFIAIFVFNLYKFWFRHVWPEIRVPPGKDRENELRLDVDRWTYLHPQLMTLAELNQHIENLMKLAEKYLYDLLELRQRRPVVFCSKLCFIFVCTAIIGNTLSGMSLIFLALITLMVAPGVYVHILPEDLKLLLRQTIGQKLSGTSESSSSDDEANALQHEVIQPQHHSVSQESTSETSSKPKQFMIASLSSTTKSIEQLFEILKQRSFPLVRNEQQAPRPSRKGSTEENDVNYVDCNEKTRLIDIPLAAVRDRPITSESVTDDETDPDFQHKKIEPTQKSSSDSLSGRDGSVSLLESDDDQQDGFVML